MEHLVEQDGLEVGLGLLLHEVLVEEEGLPICCRCGDFVSNPVVSVEEQSAEERRLTEEFNPGLDKTIFDGDGGHMGGLNHIVLL